MILILLATYNGGDFLEKQLSSIAKQSHKRWKIIARDDGSHDETRQILNEWSLRIPIQIVSTPTRGRGACANFSALLSASQQLNEVNYFALCDQDDIWHTEKLTLLKGELEALENDHPSTPCLVHSDLEVIDMNEDVKYPSFMRAQGLVSATQDPLRSLLVHNHIPGCSMLFNRALLELATPLPEETQIHDWWIALVAASYGYIKYIPRALVGYRQHSENEIGLVTGNKLLSGGLSRLRRQIARGNMNFLASVHQASALEQRGRHATAMPATSRIQAYSRLLEQKRMDRLATLRQLNISSVGRMRNLLLWWRALNATQTR